MSDDNLGNFFDAGDFGEEEENAENWKPLKLHGNSLFKKGIDILNLTESLCDVLPENDHSESTKRMMLQNAMAVPSKIKTAMAVDEIYSFVMENAVLIKINMVQLQEQLWALSALHVVEEKYLDVLRKEIEQFRKIFISWVGYFEKENDFPDDWHLFNDPSTFPDEL